MTAGLGNPVSQPGSALSGIVVLDFTQVMMGPCCTQLLGDYGAEVIKIERPPMGDLSRTAIADLAGLDNPIYLSINRNKRSVTVDLRNEQDRAVLDELIARADVIVSNFRPGVMDRIGLGYDDVTSVNPQVIWAAGCGYGPDGPMAGKGGQDVIAQAYSGVMGRNPGLDGTYSIYPTTLCDYTTGMHLFQGIVMALFHRERTGQGQKIEVNMLDSMLHMQMQEAAMEMNRGYEINWATMPLTGVFRTADSQICLVGAFKADALSRISRALGFSQDLSEDPRFDDRTKLDDDHVVLHALFADRLRTRSTEQWMVALEAEDILCAPIHSLPQALASPQAQVNRAVVEMEHPTLGTLRFVKAPVTMSRTPPRYQLPPPTIGEHNDEVIARLADVDKTRCHAGVGGRQGTS